MTTVFATLAEPVHESPARAAVFPEGRPTHMARIVLIAGLLAAPLALGAVPAWAWATLATITVVALILWGTEQLQQERITIVWPPLIWPAGLFLIFAVIQFLGGLTVDPIATREAVVKFSAAVLAFFLAVQLFATASRTVWRRLITAITIFTFALSMLAILQYFSADGLIYWTTKTASLCAFGPYANHNHYAGLMEMLMPLVVAGIFGRRGEYSFRAFSVFTVIIALAAMLLSGSRGGLIALLAEMALLAVLVLGDSSPSMRRSRWMTAALGVAASALLFALIDPGHVAPRLATVAEIPAKPDATLAERSHVHRDALRIAADYPWTGVGLGAFGTIYPRYQSFATDLVWDHAHNDYAEALAETGIVGATLIVAALLFFPQAFRGLGKRLKHEVGWIQAGATIGCCGILVHSLGDFNLHIPANAAWFAASAALATGTRAIARPDALT